MRRFLGTLLLTLLTWPALAGAGPEGYQGLDTQRFTALDAARLFTTGPTPLLNLPGRPAAKAQLQRISEHGNGDVTIRGTTDNASFHLTLGIDAAFGEIHRDGKHFLVTTDRTGSWLVEIPESGLVIDQCHVTRAEGPKAAKTSHPRSNTTSADGTVDTVIDVMIIFNRAFDRRYPGDLLQTRILHLFDIVNETAGNSELPLAFRLVGTELYDYSNNNSNGQLLVDMANALDGFTVAGLEGLGSRRDELGADIVAMIRPHVLEVRGSCGQAFIPSADRNPIRGAATVSDGMSSWSLCTDDVLTHEIGHNLGAMHQVGLGGGDFDEQGAGFFKSGQWTTVMASFGTGRPDRHRVLPVFSNPDVACGGIPCGLQGEADNSAVILTTMAEIAAYRDPATPMEPVDQMPRSLSDSDGDGVIDWEDHFPFDATESADADLDGTGDQADAFPNRAAEQADTDGDGLGNREDPDDDDDGIEDINDAFPLDSTEVADSDGDGVGDSVDALLNDANEWLDSSGDGLGDNAEPDDDGDGVPDIDTTRWDLLVVSAGNNRILRFDAASGEPRGVEVPPWDGLLTYQTGLARRAYDHSLFYGSDSAFKRLNLLDRDPLGVWLPPYDDENPGAAQLFSGFPTAMTPVFDRWRMLAVGLGTRNLRVFAGQNIARPNSVAGTLSDTQTHLDVIERNDVIYVLSKAQKRIASLNALGFQDVFETRESWMKDGRRLAIPPESVPDSADDRLFISDRGRDTVRAVSYLTGEDDGDFADLGALGYADPDGLVYTPSGEILVAASRDDVILAFDASTGEFLGERVSFRSGGLRQPRHMLLVPALADRYAKDPDRVIRPNPGLWYNPDTDGRGLDIEIFDNRLSAIWYTYENGLPIWYFSSGTLDQFEYSAPLLRFELDGDTARFTEVGSLSIRFDSERRAVATYVLGDIQDNETLQWLAFNVDPVQNDRTGLWGREDGPGWGLSLAQQGNTAVVIAFTYDAQGQPRWAISDAVEASNVMQFEMLTAFSDNLCPGCGGVPDASFQPAGTMTLSTEGQSSWSSDIAWPTPLTGTWIENETPVVRFSDTPERPR